MMRAFLKTPMQSISGFANRRWSSNITATSSAESPGTSSTTNENHDEAKAKENTTKPHKTQAQLDDEMRQKMAAMAGDGGDSGVEYEDGKPVSMKRGVRENMFRYI